jgi:pullulanase/glycogen debranching enzyme
LRRSRFLTGEYDEELAVKDVTWISAAGTEMRPEEWDDSNMHCFGMIMDGRAQPTGIRRRGEDATLLLVLNAHHDLVEFTLPETPGGREWSLLVDTNLAEDAEPESFATVTNTARPADRFSCSPFARRCPPEMLGSPLEIGFVQIITASHWSIK